MKKGSPFKFYFLLPTIILYIGCLSLISQNVNTLPSKGSSNSSGTVDHFTGTNNVNIPIWSIGVKGYTLPISLTYSATGIRVEQLASSVGLGWNLNAGGVITREVKGFPDDIIKEDYGVTQYGWLHGPYGEQISGGEISDFCGYSSEYDKTTALSKYMGDPLFQYDKEYDTEPDIFHFNLGGRTGSFIFDNGDYSSENVPVRTIPYQNIIIEYYLDSQTDEINSFSLTDENGIIYTFDQIEYTFTNTKTEIAASEELSANFYKDLYTEQTFRSAWFLSQILTPLNETINLYYNNEEARLDKSYYFEYRNFDQSNMEVVTKLFLNDNIYNNPPKICTKRISKIESENLEIKFNAYFNRLDLNHDNINEGLKSKSIDEVLISSKLRDNSVIRKFKLEYDYFESITQNDSLLYNTNLCGSIRLMLKSIQEYNGNLILRPYVFKYDYDPLDDSKKLPSRFSYSQDIWGFYNGKSNTSFVPKLFVYPDETGNDRFSVYQWQNYSGTQFLLYGEDRSVDSEKAKLCTLSEIQYPDGANSNFTYENNTFIYNGHTYEGGGIRIAAIEVYDGVDPLNNITTYYDYHSQIAPGWSWGNVLQFPIYGYFDPRNCPMPSDPTEEYFQNEYVRTNVNLSNIAECKVVYSEVTEYKQGAGKTIYEFNIPGIYGEHSDDELFETFETEYVRHFLSMNPIQLVCTSGLYFDYYSYPFPNSVNYDWNRGLLLKRTNIDESENIIAEVTNVYELFYPSMRIIPEKVFGLKIGFLENDINVLSQPVTVFSKYHILTEVSKKISVSTKRMYDQVNPSEYVTLTTQYEYNDFGQVASVKTTNSDQSETISRYTYPTDLDLSTGTDYFSEAIYTMKNELHIHSPVLEKRLLEKQHPEAEEYVAGATITKFKDFDNGDNYRILPDEILVLETNSPIESENFIELRPIAFGIGVVYDENYKPKTYFDEYDDRGNLIEFHNINDNSNANIYDFNNSIKTAQVTNAGIRECAFESYEEPGSEEILWQQLDPGYQAVSDQVVHSGSYSLWVKALSPPGQEPEGLAVETFTAGELDATKKYRFTAWVFSDNINANVSIILNIGDNNNNVLDTQTDTYDTENVGEWQLLHVETDLNDFSNFHSLQAILLNDGTDVICYFDDIKFYPSDAYMNTYTFEPFIGKTSSSDANDYYEHYVYDDLGRITTVKDKDGNITMNSIYNNEQLPVSVSPLNQDFGICLVNDNSNIYQFNCINNIKSTIAVDVTLAEGNDTEFEIITNSGNNLIQSGEVLTIEVKFSPTSSGFKNTKLIISSASLTEDITSLLLGYAVNDFFNVSPNPSSEPVTFYNTETTHPQIKTFTLNNYTLDPLTVNIQITQGSEYYSIIDPITSMPESYSHIFKVKFSPPENNTNTLSGNLNISTSPVNHLINIALEGNGITPVYFEIIHPAGLPPNQVTLGQHTFSTQIGYPSSYPTIQYRWYKMTGINVWSEEGLGGSSHTTNIVPGDCINGKFNLKCIITYLGYEYERIYVANFDGCPN